MSTPEDTTRLTDEERIYVRNAKTQFDTVADKLIAVAERIRKHSQNLDSPRSSAVSTAADAVSEFTQGVGNIGTFLWGIVHNAEHLDRFRREQSAGGDDRG